MARRQAARGAPAACPGVDPGFAIAGATAMAVSWAALAEWLPQIAGLEVPDVGVFDERFLAVVDCDIAAHIPE
jgi:hypothetical protein